jgi:hypothetical protein
MSTRAKVVVAVITGALYGASGCWAAGWELGVLW